MTRRYVVTLVTSVFSLYSSIFSFIRSVLWAIVSRLIFSCVVWSLFCLSFDHLLLLISPMVSSNLQKLKNKIYIIRFFCFFVCLMVFNATFNNISVISWRSVLRKPPTCRNSLTNFIT